MTNHLFINVAICRRLGIPIRVPPSAQEQGQADGLATSSTAVDPTEFSDTPLGTPEQQKDTAIPPHMLTPMTSGNGNEASSTGIATFAL